VEHIGWREREREKRGEKEKRERERKRAMPEAHRFFLTKGMMCVALHIITYHS